MNELANKITISPTEYFSKLGINLDDYLRIEDGYKFPKKTHELVEKVNDNLSIIYLLREFKLRTDPTGSYGVLSRRRICEQFVYPLCNKIKDIPQHKVYEYVNDELPWWEYRDFIFDKPYLHNARKKKYIRKYRRCDLTFINRKDIDILSRCKWAKYVIEETSIDIVLILSSYNRNIFRQYKSILQSDDFSRESVYVFEIISNMKHVKVSTRIFKIIFKRLSNFEFVSFPGNMAYDNLISIYYKYNSHLSARISGSISINSLHRRRCNIPESLFTGIMKNTYKMLNIMSCMFVSKNLTRLSLYY